MSISPTPSWYNNRNYNQRKLEHIMGEIKELFKTFSLVHYAWGTADGGTVVKVLC
jgi:hypothetical protein